MLDSCVCIDFFRGHSPALLAFLHTTANANITIPAIVEAELRVGAQKSQHLTRETAMVERFLSAFEIIPFDSACAVQYGIIRSQLESRGTPIGWNDYLIAATALAHGAILVTNNIREFQRVPGLVVEHWEDISF